jgi:uncharacterized alpha-E superfamily protein
MFRYLERAQNTARFLNADFSQYLEDRDNQGNLWVSLLAVTGDLALYRERYATTARESVIRFLTIDETYVNSILTCIVQARENARSIREIISSEMWEEVNSLYLLAQQYAAAPESDPYPFCKSVIDSCYLVVGLFYSTMNRGEAWHFGRLGMLLERGDKTSRILDVKYFILLPDPTWVGSSYDNTQWAALLKAVSGLEMYRKTYRRISPADVADFLIFNPTFPRSIHHCIHYAGDSLRALSGSGESLDRLRADLEGGDVASVLAQGLHGYLDDLQTRMNRVDQEIFQMFFAPQSLTTGGIPHGDPGQHQS